MLETSRRCGREILRGCARYSRTHGPWNIQRTQPYYRTNSGKKKNIDFDLLNADGVVFIDPETPERVKATGLPAVAIDVEGLIDGVINVIGNCEKIGQMGAKHFLDRGFEHFAFCGFDDIHWSRERGDAYTNYLRNAGHKVFHYKKRPNTGRSWAREKPHLTKWVVNLPRPIAVMACNDDRADNIAEVCKDCEIRVPSEIAVLGVDNDDLVCEITDPPISSISMNFEKAGFEAAMMLDRWMRGENMANATIISEPTRIIVRQSTDILAIEDPEVSEAIRFIKDHVRDNIQVADVVENASLSRRMLENRFKAAMGTTIGSQIRTLRANHIANLLLETNMSILEISYLMGFNSQANLSRYFQKEFKMNPARYRNQERRTP